VHKRIRRGSALAFGSAYAPYRASRRYELYIEEAGCGTSVVFVHEYAGDYRSWELQMRHFSRQHRCATYCLDGSIFLKRTVPTAARLLIPRAGHTINSEEQAAVNAALAKLLAAEAGRRLRAGCVRRHERRRRDCAR
jgi:pimeloyl-ACP methyl ester carboxylesterase